MLIAGSANFEHRNVSDYTPLSLAASGGYIGIVKILLAHGAEINSRTGSKLGISPLMLASMNGHTATVKLLLDMGADINAQIETNRNTALTLACFQGRHEVVSLLVERRANIEHRAKVSGFLDLLRVINCTRKNAQVVADMQTRLSVPSCLNKLLSSCYKLFQQDINRLFVSSCYFLVVMNLLRADDTKLVGTTCCEYLINFVTKLVVPNLSTTGNKQCENILLRYEIFMHEVYIAAMS